MKKNNSPAIEVGDRVLITGTHPWRGRTGKYVGLGNAGNYGEMPKVRLDNGAECFVTEASDWKRLPGSKLRKKAKGKVKKNAPPPGPDIQD